MKAIITLLLTINIIFLGCDDMKDTSKKKIDYGSIQTEIGILPKLISLPRQPLLVKWKIYNKHGNDSALLALLKFNEKDYDFIIKNSKTSKRKTNETWLIETYDKWLPEDVRSGIKVKIVGQSYELIGISRLEANLFANPKRSSYIHGAIIPLKNGYISVNLFTM
jgi:hypothetical protein